MKLVREHIFEKFTEDSDPIQDMGIGMMKKIKDFINEIPWADDINEEEYLAVCAEYGKVDFVKYLLKSGHDPNFHKSWALRMAALIGQTEIVKILLEAGADPRPNRWEALRNAVENDRHEIMRLILDRGKEYDHYRGISYMPMYKAVEWVKEFSKNKETHKILDEYAQLFEKFTEDSDPVRDLGIGLSSKVTGEDFEIIYALFDENVSPLEDPMDYDYIQEYKQERPEIFQYIIDLEKQGKIKFSGFFSYDNVDWNPIKMREKINNFIERYGVYEWDYQYVIEGSMDGAIVIFSDIEFSKLKNEHLSF